MFKRIRVYRCNLCGCVHFSEFEAWPASICKTYPKTLQKCILLVRRACSHPSMYFAAQECIPRASINTCSTPFHAAHPPRLCPCSSRSTHGLRRCLYGERARHCNTQFTPRARENTAPRIHRNFGDFKFRGQWQNTTAVVDIRGTLEFTFS